MTQLALFMAHCVAAFGLLGMQALRRAETRRLRAALPDERAVFFRVFRRAGRRLALGGLAAEAGTGLALLVFAPWRESPFGMAMALLPVLWAGNVVADRLGRGEPSGTAARRLELVEGAILFGMAARVAILVLVALV